MTLHFYTLGKQTMLMLKEKCGNNATITLEYSIFLHKH